MLSVPTMCFLKKNEFKECELDRSEKEEEDKICVRARSLRRDGIYLPTDKKHTTNAAWPQRSIARNFPQHSNYMEVLTMIIR
jgi:hypothetical protein